MLNSFNRTANGHIDKAGELLMLFGCGDDMPTMNVSLSEEFVEFVNGKVASGEYGTASEVVRDALRLLRREKAAHEEKLAILRREIALGVEDMRAGRLSNRTARDISAEIDAEDVRRRR